MGHPGARLARCLGVPPATVWSLLRGATTATVSPDLDAAIRTLYERIWNLRSPEHTGAERRPWPAPGRRRTAGPRRWAWTTTASTTPHRGRAAGGGPPLVSVSPNRPPGEPDPRGAGGARLPARSLVRQSGPGLVSDARRTGPEVTGRPRAGPTLGPGPGLRQSPRVESIRSAAAFVMTCAGTPSCSRSPVVRPQRGLRLARQQPLESTFLLSSHVSIRLENCVLPRYRKELMMRLRDY